MFSSRQARAWPRITSDWARIDVTATTPLVNQNGNAAEWLMQTFTNTAGTAGEQNDNPPVLIGDITNPVRHHHLR